MSIGRDEKLVFNILSQNCPLKLALVECIKISPQHDKENGAFEKQMVVPVICQLITVGVGRGARQEIVPLVEIIRADVAETYKVLMPPSKPEEIVDERTRPTPSQSPIN